MHKTLRALSFITLCLIALSSQALASKESMKIKMTIKGGETLTATMEDNNAAKDFVALLPLTLDMRDFAGTEKVAGSLPKKLDISDAPQGHKPRAGDLAHYAPWNNLAAFYKDDQYASGLVLLGRFDDDPALLSAAASITVTIEAMETDQ